MKNPFKSIKNIKARRLAFLEDEISHYNSKNRSMKVDGFCMYSPAHAKTEGCAIGRWLKRDNKIIKKGPETGVVNSIVAEHLPK